MQLAPVSPNEGGRCCGKVRRGLEMYLFGERVASQAQGFQACQVLHRVLGASLLLPQNSHSNFASANIHPKCERGMNRAIKVNRHH